MSDSAPIVLVEQQSNTATVTINRADRRNALSAATVTALRGAFAELADDRDVHAIVLTGAGEKSFCAGGDLSDMAPADGVLEMHHRRGEFADLLLDIQHQPQPVIGRINGDALGGGFGLTLACDVAVAAEHARFGTPEIKVGLFPMMIMALIRRHVGPKATMEMMLTGQRFDAHHALELGCINRVVPTEELDAATAEIAGKIASFSPAIQRLGRKAYYETQDMSFEESLRTLHNELTLATMSEDAAEGVMAFLGKRPANWKGR